MGPERDVSTGSRVPTARRGDASGEQAAVGRRADDPPTRAGGPWKAAFFALTAAAILATAIWALLGSSLLVARSVRVTGAPAAQRAGVLRAAAITAGHPLRPNKPTAGALRAEELTQIQSAQVSRDWPDSV